METGHPGRKAIIGLGNPGPQYAQSRHNLGFFVIEALVGALPQAQAQQNRLGHFDLLVREDGLQLILLRPLTYMNLSGEAVAFLCQQFQLALSDLLVVVDDFALPLGRVRLRAKGSHGGHNGLRNITEVMDSKDYARLKVGIGPLPENTEVVDFVLGEFEENEKTRLPAVVELARDCALCWLDEGVEPAMSQFNGRMIEPDEATGHPQKSHP